MTFAGTEFTTSGLVNGDSIASVTRQRRGGGDGPRHRLALRHHRQRRGGRDGYRADRLRHQLPAGNLTVNPRALIVTANNTTMVLGGPVPTFSAYYVGL